MWTQGQTPTAYFNSLSNGDSMGMPVVVQFEFPQVWDKR